MLDTAAAAPPAASSQAPGHGRAFLAQTVLTLEPQPL